MATHFSNGYRGGKNLENFEKAIKTLTNPTLQAILSLPLIQKEHAKFVTMN
jgi:hypothetical protein